MAALPTASSRITMEILPVAVVVKFGSADEAIGRFSRDVFLVWMLVILLGPNGFVLFVKARLNCERLNVPWRTYWSSSTRRKTEAAARMREVMVMMGLLVNGGWLIGYHLLMQEAGSSLGLSISPSFGVYLIVSGTVVLVYGAISYFHPP